MLEKKTKIKSLDLLILLTWLKGETVVTNTPFNYDFLFAKSQKNYDEYLKSKEELTFFGGEVEESYIEIESTIDQIMIDLFHIYIKLLSSQNDIEEALRNEFSKYTVESQNSNSNQNDVKEHLKNELKNFSATDFQEFLETSIKGFKDFIRIYENILFNTKFKSDEMINNQKNIVESLMKTHILNEEYEKCIPLKKIIEEVNI